MTNQDNEVGLKYDQDKPMYSLLPPDALRMVTEVLTYGANKYSPDNWNRVEDLQRRYFDAAMRHQYQDLDEAFDAESGYAHLAHAICCLLFKLQDHVNHGRYLDVSNDSYWPDEMPEEEGHSPEYSPCPTKFQFDENRLDEAVAGYEQAMDIKRLQYEINLYVQSLNNSPVLTNTEKEEIVWDHLVMQARSRPDLRFEQLSSGFVIVSLETN